MKWERTVRRATRRSGRTNDTGIAYKKTLAAVLFFMGLGTVSNFIYADVTVADQNNYGHTVTSQGLTGGGKQYDIQNQQVNSAGTSALNKFDQFQVGQQDIANLHLGTVDRQINIVNNKINVDGVVNALKGGNIGGDVYFFSSQGIAVGATGVFNVGRLTLGTNPAFGENLYKGMISKYDDKTAAEKAALLGGSGRNVTIQGKIYAADGDVLIGAGSEIDIQNGSEIYTGVTFNTPVKTWSAEEYRKSIVNLKGVENASSAVATTAGVALVSGGKLQMNGTIESVGTMDARSGDELTMGGTVKTKGKAVTIESKKKLTLSGTVESKGGAVQLNATDDDLHMSGSIASAGGDVTIKTEDNLYIEGSVAKKASITSGGGNIKILVDSDDADLQAKPGEVPPDGMISIKEAYIDSSSTEKDSGNIAIQADRDVMGISRIDINGATINAGGANGRNAGNVTISATATTNLHAWDIGDGAYALINIGKKENNPSETEKKSNTIIGDNVSIAAIASTTGETGDNENITDEEIQSKINGLDSSFADLAANLRFALSATKIVSEAKINVYDADIQAVGGNKGGMTDDSGKTVSHGNLSIVSDAKSKIAPITGNIVGYGVNVGISDVTSTINIDRSDLYSHGDTAIKAAGDNRVELTYIELALLDSYVRSTMNMSWAELSSNVEANVGEKATITSGNGVDISAKSVRSLSSSVSNGSDRNVIGIAASVAIADTNANASMAGTVYAGGDVSVKADNTVAEEDGVYKADTSKAASMSGDSALKPIVNTAMDGGKSLWSWVKGKFGKVSEKVADVTDESKPWNKVGVNASTALLFSENDATASVTGKVRGVEMTDGKVVGKDTLGAESLSVYAHNLSRTNVRVSSYQQDLTEFNKPDKPSERKETGVAAAIGYASQNNTAEAYIGGDVKVQNDVDVTAKIEIPWQTKLEGTGTTALMNAVFQAIDSNPILPDLVDMWAQSSGGGEETSTAVSVSVINYDNSAKAYIGKKDENDKGTVKVEAGGDVTVDAKSDITTVNFSGNIKNPLKSSAINAPVGFYTGDFNIFNNYIGKDGQAANTIGGSVLYVGQDNTVDAYIGDGADVNAVGDVKVTANAEAWNLAMAASGGLAGSLGLNGTISVNRIVNTTNAYIGKANVTADGDVLVEATDDSTDLNIGGVVSVSGGDGVGATIAYNEINRNTAAYSLGHIKAVGNATVNALNTGEIYALSAAGSVAYTEKKLDGTEIEGSGESIGGDSDSASDISNWIPGLAGEDFSQDPDNWLSEGMDNIQSAGETVSGVMDEGQEAADMTETAKNSFAAAANVSVNRIKDHAKAYIAGTNGDVSVKAGALRVTTLNDSVIYAANATMALNFATGGDNNKSLAGSFMWNSITAENDAYVDGATLTLTGDEKEGTDQALVVEAINDERILNIAASGAGTRKGSAYAGQVSVNWVDTTNNAYVKNSTVKADEAVTIHAENGENIDSYTGAVAIAGGTAVGASVAVNLVDGKTNAYFKDSSMEGTENSARGGKLSVNAEDTSEITSIVASGSANLGGGKFAGAFSGNGNDVGITTNAYVDTTKAIKAKDINIEAANKSIATIGTGGVAASVGGGSAAGGSVGVMINDSSVSAYMKGDGTKTNTIDANSITINAKNLYNGSATDSEEDETAKNVAVGGAVSTGKFAFAGSITVNKIDQNTDAYLGAGKYNVNKGNVDIDAYTVSNLFGMAGGLAVGKTAAVGAAIDTQIYSGHTYASIEDGADVANADVVSVDAVSEEHMTSVAAMGAVTVNPGQEAVSFSGAGAAGAHKISTDTKAYIGNRDDKTVSKENAAKLSDVGTITVNAKDTTKLGTGAGSAAVAASISGAGVGLSAAVEVVNKNVGAFVGNNTSISAGGLSVTAENTSESTTAAAGLGAGGAAGIAGSASETSVNHTTKAYVGESASVTVDDEARMKATSGFIQGAGAGSVGAGAAAGIGLANTTVKLTADTNAYVGNKASITGGSVKVAADHTTKITYATVAGGLSSTVGISGAVGVNYLDTTTHATIGESADVKAMKTSGDVIELTAKDETILNGGTGGLSAGLGGAGAGAAVTVNHIKKNTEASVGKNASLSSKGNIKLDAKNTENILNATVQASGGLSAGLAGAVTVTDIYDITKAYTDTGVKINQERDYKESGGDITVNAEHAIEQLDSIVAGAAGGGLSIGAAVDVATIKTLTNAYIGDGNQVNTAGALSITANDKMENISSVPVSASIGSFGLAGSFSIYSFSNDVDKSNLNGKVSEEGGTKTFDDWINEQMNQSGKDVGTALGAYGGDVMGEIQKSLPEDFSSAPTTASEIGTAAKIGNGSIIQAKSVTVDAKDKIGMTTGMGNLAGGAASAGASVAVLSSNTQVQAVIDKSARISTTGPLRVNAEANHTLNTTIVGAAVGGVAIQGTVQTWKDETNVYAKVGTDETDDATQIEADSIEVKADNDRTLKGTITGASAALLGAASGSVITADIGGESIASIGKVNMAATGGDVTIASTADTDLDATAVAAAVGYYSGAGTGAVLSSHVNIASTIASGAKLSGGNLSIISVNTPKLSATAGAAAGGMAAVGATVAKVESKDNASVTVGDGVFLKADDKVTIKAETARPEGEDNLYAKAIAGSGGVIAGAVSTTDVILNQNTSVTIGKNNTIEAGKLDILAKHEDATNFRNESVAAGGVSGTGAETKTDIDSTVTVSIGDNTKITTKEETAVKALNRTLKGNYDGSNSTKTVYSGGASLANGNGIVNDTDIDHITKVDIGNGVKIQAAASALTEEEKTAGKTLADKNAIAIDAQSDITAKDYYVIGTGAAIGAAHIKNTMDASADTDVAVGTGAEFLAGDTEAASKSYTDNPSATETHFGQNVGGGSIAVAAKNTADLESKTLVDIFGAAGYAGGSNDVTYDSHADTAIGGSTKLETANGDIRLAAGRDSDGNIGTVSVKAVSNILNATAIPVSVVKDPHAKATHDVKITVNEGAELLSDRDIYLQSRAMEEDVQVSGSGEIKDWTRKVGEIFGASSSIGKTTRDYTAQVEFNGKAETGIHRNQSITIGGTNDNGTWKTEIERTGGISYDFTTNVEVGKALLERLDELRDLKAKYSSDEAAVAAYDAEISFLEEKLVANGLGVFETDKNGNRTFVEFDLETKSDLEIANNEIGNLQKLATDKDGNPIVDENGKQLTVYEVNMKLLEDSKAESDERVSAMDKLSSLNKTWKEAEQTSKGAATDLETKHSEYTTAQDKYEDAVKAFNDAVKDLEGVKADDPRYDDLMKVKNEAYDLKASAEEVQNTAKKAWEDAGEVAVDAKAAADKAKSDLTTAVGEYDTAYGTNYLNAAAGDSEVEKQFADERTDYENLSKTIGKASESAKTSYTTLQDSIAASDHFHKVGKENGDGTFSYTGDAGKLTLDEETGIYTWTYKDSEGTEHSGIVLHQNSYGLTTSEVRLGDIEARLGDIVGEGQEIYGSGSLVAHGDAMVTITNNSPNNIITGDIQIKGGSSVVASEDGETAINKVGGGTITWNGQAMHSDSDLTNQNDSQKDKNAETKYEFTGSVTTKKDAAGANASSVTIESTFNPTDKENLHGGKIAYAAPTIQVGTAGGENLVYNPGGSVTVKSAYGDIYNNATVNAGGVSIEATNGDFVQSYVNRITSVSGNPNDASKDTGVGTGSGILANGNIFISARYVNINGTIQSGIAEWNVEIPKNPSLYYKDGDTKVFVSIANAAKYKDKMLYVENASGNGADYVTYDPDSQRFLLSGIEVNGGTVDIVGTIMNTAKDGAKAGKILALDGYGSITVKNNSNIDLELGNLSTGSGVEGKITITDLDLKTGEKKNTVTYTRKDGVVYKNGNAQEGDVVYTPSDGIYYVWQTGQDSTTVTSYHHRSKEFNIFGKWGNIGDLIENSEVTDVKTTDQYDIDPDGTFVGDANAAHRNAEGDDYYQSSEETYTTSTSEAYDKKTKTKRLWYSLGTVKQYDTYFKVKTGTTTITTNSIKANQNIGIGFVGNEAGGTLSVNGGTANVYVGGVITNQGGSAGGSTAITAGSIQQGDYGFIHTDALTLTATKGSVGGEKTNETTGKISVNNAIQTDAAKLSGSAKGSLSVIVTDHGVNLGSISAGNTVSISAGGDIIQDSGANPLSANRVVLNTGNGKIAGGNGGAFRIAVGRPGEKDNEENYGLQANASGDISFENTNGDLYVDSVISSAGDVTISTEGSFIDNNFTDVDDATAQEKLLAWAEAAVLEGADQTEAKQKDMLKAQVDSDYAQWKQLAGYTETWIESQPKLDTDGNTMLGTDGKVVMENVTKTRQVEGQIDSATGKLTESARNDAIAAFTDESGNLDQVGLESYVSQKETSYAKLKAQGVADWTDDKVSGFKNEIENAVGIYGKANLTKTELADKFTFLNADDVANTLVGSAKSAEQLLIGFAPGGIKDGITDTNITIKGTPHVSGNTVTLKSTKSGSIGSKVTAADIDLSKEGWYNSLSKADLLALSTAEQGDFQYAGNKITVSTVKGIDVEAAGAVNAITQNGSIYLVSEGAMNLGTIEANGGELRIKASGNLIGGGTAISAGGNIVLESGSGEISSIVLDKEGTGILTARAKDGVSISKAGDLVINTFYAAEGDVTLDVSDGEDTHDILVSDGTDDANKGNDKNIKGQNITLLGVDNLGTEVEGETKSLGIEVTDVTDEDGTITGPGKFTAHIEGDGDITVYGEMGDADFSTKKDLRLHNEGLISGGKYKVEGTLTLWNNGTRSESIGEDGSMSGITGGEFDANHVQLENHATIASGHFKANESYTVNNREGGSFVKMEKDGETIQATVESQTVTVNNWGTVSGGIFHATGKRGGKGNVTYTAHENAKTEGGTLISDNADVNITASGGNVTFDKIQAVNGSANISGVKDLSIADVHVGGKYAVETSGDAVFETVKAGAVTITAGGSVTGKELTTKASETLGADGSVKVDAKSDVNIKYVISSGNTGITAGGTLASESIKAEGQDVSIATAGKTEIGSLTAGTTDIEATGEGSHVAINEAAVSGTHNVNAKGNATFDTVNAGTVGITAGGSVSGTTLTTTAGNAGLKAGQDISIRTISSAESITGTAGGTLTSESIKANENVTLNSKDDMKITDLEAGKTASLGSGEGNVDLIRSKIQGALSVNAGKDITVTTSESVSLNMNAGGSILATGEEAKISSGDITLTAREDITISNRTGGVQKLEGVDTDGQPGNVTGVGTAAPLVNGESAGDPFDTSTTGSAAISSSTGTITMEAGKIVSADHVVLGKEETVLDKGETLNINANVVGIDSLESHGTDKVTVTVKGNDKPAYHVGIHSGTDASVTVKDSYIQHLDLTGKDNIGIENTAISGNSRLETDKIFVDIRDNPGNSQAQGFGHITLSGYDISSGGHFTDIHDGITINGATRPVTAMSVMNRSLYGPDYAGKDAEEKAREESTDANVEILFAEVMSYEKYHSIRM